MHHDFILVTNDSYYIKINSKQTNNSFGWINFINIMVTEVTRYFSHHDIVMSLSKTDQYPTKSALNKSHMFLNSDVGSTTTSAVWLVTASS